MLRFKKNRTSKIALLANIELIKSESRRLSHAGQQIEDTDKMQIVPGANGCSVVVRCRGSLKYGNSQSQFTPVFI